MCERDSVKEGRVREKGGRMREGGGRMSERECVCVRERREGR